MHPSDQLSGTRPRYPRVADRTAIKMWLRDWHGVVPKDCPLFSVERRDTTHEM